MEKCKTCKQWMHKAREETVPLFATCTSRKMWPVTHPEGLRGRADDELAFRVKGPIIRNVITGMNFGCVHHEEREEE